jgi:putative ABC transport system substrate-binding protein
MRRRAFISLLGSAAAAWPLAARAEQPVPAIGVINAGSPDAQSHRMRAFREGLKDTGYLEGENVSIEYRWGENQTDRVPALVTELIRRQVAVIVATGGSVPALAAKAGTTTIPIVFTIPEDPVRLGLVASLARPGGNATGINFFSNELIAKRLELLRELVLAARHVAVLLDPADANAETLVRDVDTAARTLGLQIQFLKVSTSQDIDATFATFARERPDAVFISGGPLFVSRRVQLVLLAARHSVPASYGSREYAEIGGLMSYGTSLTDAYRQVGVYAGRILKGAKPADLPVMQATKFELVINHAAARVLGLTVPPSLLARADEVIE